MDGVGRAGLKVRSPVCLLHNRTLLNLAVFNQNWTEVLEADYAMLA